MAAKYMGVGDEAVQAATGRGWEQWFELLDDAGALQWSHKQMVAFLVQQGLDKPWWQQMVSSTYERVRGLKQVGETADAGFQVGVQRSLPIGAEALWELLLSPQGLGIWLGARELPCERGQRYQAEDGTVGQVRTFKPVQRLRLTWQPPYLERHTTLQLTLSCPRNTRTRTTLRFHHERLLDREQRELMRTRWRAVLDKLAAVVREGPASKDQP